MSELTIEDPVETACRESPIAEPILTVIVPRKEWELIDFAELWRFRELWYFLAHRDIKVRYKQTVLGLGWAIAQPLATMAVFSLFLGKATGISEGIEHYGLFVFAGMVAWTFFSNTVTTAANSIVANERLVTKIYFPRLIIPLSTVGVGLFDFGIASILLMLMAVGYGVIPSWWIIFLPIVVCMLAVTAAGIGVLLSAIIVTQRDFKYILSFGMQLWMFATPCLYMSPASIGDRAAIWLPLNPAHGLIKTFRQVWLGGEFDAYAFGVSAGVGMFMAVVGLLYFRRVEQTFADNI